MSSYIYQSHKRYSRNGAVNRGKVMVRQDLHASLKNFAGSFVAVICDPDTGQVLKEVELWRPTEGGELVSLRLDWLPDVFEDTEQEYRAEDDP